MHVVDVEKRPIICKAFGSEIASGLCDILIADDSDDDFILKRLLRAGVPSSHNITTEDGLQEVHP